MKTIRYKSEYLEQIINLLKNTRNTVNLPSDDYNEIARLFEEADENGEALNKLFKKLYTVLAVEDDIPVGIASMDREGQVGIFAVSEGETSSKTSRLLAKELESLATKKEVPVLYIFPVEGNEKLFIEFGFTSYNAATGETGGEDCFMLIKQTSINEKVDLKPEEAKTLKLNPSKKITVEGKVSIFPAIFFGVACFFALILTFCLLHKTVSKYISLIAVIGTFFAVALGILIAYIARGIYLKKKITSQMSVTNGKIISVAQDLVLGKLFPFRAESKLRH